MNTYLFFAILLFNRLFIFAPKLFIYFANIIYIIEFLKFGKKHKTEK